jgi:putative serine protease PepD
VAALVGAAVATAVLLLAAPRSSAPSRSTVPAATSSASATPASARGTALSASAVYKQDSGGVVAIKATSPLQQDSGTGIVLSRDGLIVTNDHVVSGATSLSVTVGSSSSSRPAQVVGESPNTDLAVIKVDPSGLNLNPLTLAQSSTVGVGDPVYAIGNPYGLNQTLTRGIVSALGRQISAPNGASINGAIQTDAALNPGNSGGPLIDARGQVIGVNSQIASAQASASGQAGSTGVGFAIASDTVKIVVAQLERTHPGAIQSPAQQAQQVQVPGGVDPNGQPAGPYGGGGADGQPYVIVPGAGGQVAIVP